MLYLVSPFAQDKEVTAYCFGKCGKVLLGGVTVEGGGFFPCRTDVCPYLEQSMDLGDGEVLGKLEQVIVRKLSPMLSESKAKERDDITEIRA